MRDLAASVPEHELRLAAMFSSEYDDDVRDDFPDVAIGLLSVHRAIREADVLHAHQRIAALFMRASAPRKKLVEHIHNEFSDKKFISFRSPVIIAVSHRIAQHTQRVYRRSVPIRVIPNGVPELAPPGEDRGRDLKTFHLLAAGRMATQKDPIRFLALVDALRNHAPNLTATWVGGGELEEAFLRERERLGLSAVVDYTAWLPRQDLINLMARSSALVITSTWEGLPLVALEAMSVGTPVITTECGEIADVVGRAQAGLVWPEKYSANLFAQQFEQTVPHDWFSFSRSARSVYEREFSIDTMAKRMKEVYET
ncbi:hypothetical protein DBR36_09850 [Microbacterium sp. HMWF026]|nr:hypothetical protein DBR36_09850 [Microbacterium sp. HMWF026]